MKNNLFSESRAYLIGIKNYDHLPSLETPLKDVEAVKRALRDKHEFEVECFYDTTAEGFRGAFKQIKRDCTCPDERVVIYYAGHGCQNDDAYGLSGFFATKDSTRDESSMVPMQEVREIVEALPCRHLLLVLDCCFAGGFASRLRDIEGAAEPGKRLFRQRFNLMLHKPSRMVLASTTRKQRAIDRVGRSRGSTHSPFAEAFLEALNKAGKVAHNESFLLTAHGLLHHLLEHTSLRTDKQSAQLDRLDTDGEGEFCFFLGPVPDLTDKELKNPYKELKPYERTEASTFRGRRAATEKLKKHFDKNRLTVVVGASGSGKSSLVQAGLWPLLEKEHKTVKGISPGGDPAAALNAAGSAWDVLFVDQWEELFTQNPEHSPSRDYFFEKLLGWLADDRRRIVATVRSEYEKKSAGAIDAKTWENALWPVPPFTNEEYREIVHQPVRLADGTFDPPGLVERICDDVNMEMGALPLLSFLMHQLFEKASERVERGEDLMLTLKAEDYEEMGGIREVLNKKADGVLDGLGKEDQNAMRILMLRGLAQDERGRTKRRIYHESLDMGGGGANRTFDRVRNLLVDQKLFSAHRPRGGAYVEMVHDILARDWPKMDEWVANLTPEGPTERQGADNFEICAKIRTAAQDWRDSGERENLLWSDNATWVDEGLKLHGKKEEVDGFWFDRTEVDFLNESRKARQDKAEVLQSKNRVMGVFLVAAFVAALGACYWGWEANEKKKDAEASLQKAIKSQINEAATQVGQHLLEAEVMHDAEADTLAFKLFNESDSVFERLKTSNPSDSDLVKQAEKGNRAYEWSRQRIRDSRDSLKYRTSDPAKK